MANREGATDQRQSDILANFQQAILNGTRCFETDDVDDSVWGICKFSILTQTMLDT